MSYTRIRHLSATNGCWRRRRVIRGFWIFHKTYSSNRVNGQWRLQCNPAACVCKRESGCVRVCTGVYVRIRICVFKGYTAESTFTVVASGRVRSFAV
jgi:hypothetical protein